MSVDVTRLCCLPVNMTELLSVMSGSPFPEQCAAAVSLGLSIIVFDKVHHLYDIFRDMTEARSRALENIGRVYARIGEFDKAVNV